MRGAIDECLKTETANRSDLAALIERLFPGERQQVEDENARLSEQAARRAAGLTPARSRDPEAARATMVLTPVGALQETLRRRALPIALFGSTALLAIAIALLASRGPGPAPTLVVDAAPHTAAVAAPMTDLLAPSQPEAHQVEVAPAPSIAIKAASPKTHPAPHPAGGLSPAIEQKLSEARDLIALGNVVLAERIYDELEAMPQAKPQAILARAELSLDRGKYSDAAAQAEHALRLGVGPRAHLIAGQAQLRMGLRQPAIAHFRAVLAAQPGNKEALAALQRAGVSGNQ
jgi:hypothetical protein